MLIVYLSIFKISKRGVIIRGREYTDAVSVWLFKTKARQWITPRV